MHRPNNASLFLASSRKGSRRQLGTLRYNAEQTRACALVAALLLHAGPDDVAPDKRTPAGHRRAATRLGRGEGPTWTDVRLVRTFPAAPGNFDGLVGSSPAPSHLRPSHFKRQSQKLVDLYDGRFLRLLLLLRSITAFHPSERRLLPLISQILIIFTLKFSISRK
jgi:hypothetical protein